MRYRYINCQPKSRPSYIDCLVTMQLVIRGPLIRPLRLFIFCTKYSYVTSHTKLPTFSLSIQGQLIQVLLHLIKLLILNKLARSKAERLLFIQSSEGEYQYHMELLHNTPACKGVAFS